MLRGLWVPNAGRRCGDGCQQAFRAAFEGGIGGGFGEEDRRLAALLAGKDGFLVPVGALDEADDDGCAARTSEAFDAGDVVHGVAEVGLDDDADAVPAGEFGIAERIARRSCASGP